MNLSQLKTRVQLLEHKATVDADSVLARLTEIQAIERARKIIAAAATHACVENSLRAVAVLKFDHAAIGTDREAYAIYVATTLAWLFLLNEWRRMNDYHPAVSSSTVSLDGYEWPEEPQLRDLEWLGQRERWFVFRLLGAAQEDV